MTEKPKRGRPKTGETPIHCTRVPDARWNAAKEKAEREGKTISDVVNDALEKYVRRGRT
ncbi:MAG TPA: hypothetical protein VGL93_10940 [Streptosporangiaceae bacterium]|jgi:hypothetical protein